MVDEKPAYKRILLKLSGEALMGDDAFGINRRHDCAHGGRNRGSDSTRGRGCPWSLAAATSSVALRVVQLEWTVPLQITWAC